MDGPINSLWFSHVTKMMPARWRCQVALVLIVLSFGAVLVHGEAMTSLSVERPEDLKPLVKPTSTSVPKIIPPETRMEPAPQVETATVPVIPVAKPVPAAAATKIVPAAAEVPVLAPLPAATVIEPSPATTNPVAAVMPPAPVSETPATTSTASTLSPLESMPIRNTRLEALPKNTTLDDKTTTRTPWGGLFASAQVLGALALVLGLIFGGKALLRRFVPGAAIGSGKGVLEILARYPLGKNQSLVLLRLGSQLVLLCQGKDNSQSLLVVSDPQEVANILGQVQGSRPDSIQAGFSNLLASASKELEQTPPAAAEPTDDAEEIFARGTAAARLASNRPMSVRVNPNASKSLSKNLDEELDEMAAARRQLMDLRQKVSAVRQRLPG